MTLMTIETYAALVMLLSLLWLFISAIDIAVKLDRQSSIALIVVAFTLLMTIGSVAITLYNLGKQSETKNQLSIFAISLTYSDVCCWLPKNK